MAEAGTVWHPEDIKAALRKRYPEGICRLSIRWGLSRAAISRVLINSAESVPTERRIAEALDEHPYSLWPDRWTPEGKPLPRRRKHAAEAPSDHRQNREAA